ncbi:ImmA/IrrE family metallo-endopeptidase [Streptomyces odonnellii]|uniref:ImmA/IrrE family metallo-endopeptidase n=1 Tax=Streptomyces odonnellii TaxID=1417980 RepID=UPI000698588D|nr:hypothetical protein [Streptomyces odonnellii]
MPRTGILAAMLRNAASERLLTAKGTWGVPATALAHRLHDLDLMPEWPYRHVIKQLAHTTVNESPDRTPETSRLLLKVIEFVRAQGMSVAEGTAL